MLPITASLMPAVQTRQALLIIDLQNDFVSPDGALPVTAPEGYVSRALNFAKAFRNSGVGDVIWVRSEFAESRALSADGDQIMTSDAPPIPARLARSTRGRTPTSGLHDDALQEADEEAFLSAGDDKNKVCVRPGTSGAEFAPEVQLVVDPSRDIIITKTHYSAFSTGQRLIQTLRGRFITEMYVCGALSNISIYATALDAGRHGYDMTLVEDCCGYRDEMRHMNTVRRVGELLGTEPMTSKVILNIIQPKPKPSSRSRPSASPGAPGESRNNTGSPRRVSPVRSPASTGLSPLISSVSLSSGRADAPIPPPLFSPQPQRQAVKSALAPRSPRQPGVATRTDSKQPISPRHQTILVDEAPLEVDPDTEEPTSDDSPREPDRDSRKRPADADRSMQKETSPKSIKLPDRTKRPPLSTSMPAEPKRNESLAQKQSEDNKEQLSEPILEKTDDPIQNVSDKALITKTKAGEKMYSQPTSPNPNSSEALCEGDTTIITEFLPATLATDAFERLKNEVSWAGMSHLGGEVPRRVAVQGEIDEEGNVPVYRHPSDESPQLLPFSPAVLEIKKATEKHLGHPLNHVLIQHYRSGNDYISEHSDKTLDIVRGSFIANVSLGAQRSMVFRTKRADKDPAKKFKPDSGEDGSKPSSPTTPAKRGTKEDTQKRQVQRAALPHNSLCRMGLKTNERWLHAIKQDKRSDREKTASELAYNGERISLTFRQIGTYLNATQGLIWGQGATSKTKKDAQPVVNGQTAETVKMLQAFGNENHSSEFDWAARYGEGFDVVHMGTPKRFCRGPNPVINMRVDVALAELGISVANGSVASSVRFEDNDIGRAVLEDCSAILLYLDAAYGPGRRHDHSSQADLAKRFGRFSHALGLWEKWREVFEDIFPEAETIFGPVPPKTIRKVLGSEIKEAVMFWDKWAKEEAKAAHEKAGTAAAVPRSTAFYMAGGDSPSIVDYALWPVLHEIVRVCGEDVLGGAEEDVARYYNAFRTRSAVVKVLTAGQSGAQVGTEGRC